MTIALQNLREVAIAELVVSDEFPLRLERPHVRELADSIAELGCIHPPLARAEPNGDYTLGPGEDRVAAHVLLGLSTVIVRLIHCEDHELELLREAENRVRRKESSAELLEMVERLTAERDKANEALVSMADANDGREELHALREAADDMPGTERMLAECLDRIVEDDPDPDGLIDEDPEPGRKGRPKSARMRAVERVAAETGRNPDSVRKAVEREEKRREKASVECWGREQAPEWLEPVLALRKTITGVYDRMKAAAGTLTATKLDMTHEREELRNTARAIRARRPAAVCAWCKNVDRYVTDCTGCQGRGWISEEMFEQVPDVLRDPRKAMVQGQEVELEYNPPHNPPLGSYGPEGGADHGEVEIAEDVRCKGCGLTADLCECECNFQGHVGIGPDADIDGDSELRPLDDISDVPSMEYGELEGRPEPGVWVDGMRRTDLESAEDSGIDLDVPADPDGNEDSGIDLDDGPSLEDML